MSNSIQVSPSASAGVQQSKHSSVESTDNSASSEDSGDFIAALASAESENESVEQQLSDNSSDLLNTVIYKEPLSDGNSLPAEEQTALWQALFLLQQPTEHVMTKSAMPEQQSFDLLSAQRKPISPLSQLTNDYFTTMTMQNKDAGAPLPAGIAVNNMNMQLAAAQFIPEGNEPLLLNMTEQLTPVQGINSTLTQSLAAVGLGTATQAAATQTQMAPLNLGQNAWETNLGSRLQMMVGQNVQTAEIRLDPPELGALEIKIKITNDVASVNITSAHTQVREALETAVPKLREMFAESGIELGDVNVRQESSSQQQNTSEEGNGAFQQTAGSELPEEQMLVSRKIVSDNLLDIYA